ncbi:MAG: hypothetical protein IPO14_04575 [Saprospiraceae bacterium]|nr:hypothetical protein [Saprospiraceae bacterium]
MEHLYSTVTGTNGCTSTDEVMVTEDKVAPIADAGSEASINCDIKSGRIDSYRGGTYLWSDGAPTANMS